VPERTKDQVQRKMTKRNSVIYGVNHMQIFLAFWEMRGQKDKEKHIWEVYASQSPITSSMYKKKL